MYNYVNFVLKGFNSINQWFVWS